MMGTRHAVIGRIPQKEGCGLAYLTDIISDKTFPFCFDKIIGYRGELAVAIGLVTGSKVEYSLTAGGFVESVNIL